MSSVIAAWRGRAHRIELCENLEADGITPHEKLISQAVAAGMPVQVLIRPREGNFVYTSDEVRTMTRSIRMARVMGAHGVVIGALTNTGMIDKEAMKRMMEETDGLSVTFHRAFDVCIDPKQALEDIIQMGCERLLTSGQACTAEEGIPLIRELVDQAAGRIIIMPGAGVNERNAMQILKQTGATEIHGSLRQGEVTSSRIVSAIVTEMEGRKTTDHKPHIY